MKTKDAKNFPTEPPDAETVEVDDPVILRAELSEQKDQYLRLAADFDNFKKRTRRDSGQAAAAEKESFIRDLLPVLDNLERAMTADCSPASTALHQGVAITLQQLVQLLHRHGIEAAEDVGQPFDPHRHEAVCMQHDPHQPDQIILRVTHRGYCCGDQVFRPAKVIVNHQSPSGGACRDG
jgi:molecular chaperone GrpE